MRTDAESVAQNHTGSEATASARCADDAGRVIFVTNRGPIEHGFGPENTPVARPGAGGVVSGLLSAATQRSVSWISVAMTEADRIVARSGRPATIAASGLNNVTSRLVHVPEATYRRHYDTISNRVLWFTHHNLVEHDLPEPGALWGDWDAGYVAVNAALADATIAHLHTVGEETPVVFHDYQLYLAPRMVRQRMPHARMQHFVHVPWPAPTAWERIPLDIVRMIFQGLIANDVVGFQTARDAHHFMEGVKHYLPWVELERDPDELVVRDRRVLVRAYPIALTPATVRAAAASTRAQEQASRLRDELRLAQGRKLIVRVDRVEPTKNIVRGFEAYEKLLQEHPEWRERVVFLALLVPSRESLPEYRAYAAEIRQAIKRVNARFGSPGWQPIVAIFGNDRARALACMRNFDVLLVNPLVDGMNLVAKEGGLLNTRDGVLVLSRRAGAYAQLHHGVLGVEPEDIDGTAHALQRALSMSDRERAALAENVRNVLERESAAQWLQRQLGDLHSVTAPSHESAAARRIAPVAPSTRLLWNSGATPLRGNIGWSGRPGPSRVDHATERGPARAASVRFSVDGARPASYQRPSFLRDNPATASDKVAD